MSKIIHRTDRAQTRANIAETRGYWTNRCIEVYTQYAHDDWPGSKYQDVDHDEGQDIEGDISRNSFVI